jgi:hypothetical protein
VPLLDGVDWEIVGLFAALVLVEGLRRVPAGALVVGVTWWNGWEPAGETEPRARWRLVSWWSPLAPSLVLPPLSGPPVLSTDELAARLRVARRSAPWLAGGGALTLAALILGLPVASARLGALGFLAGAAVVLALASATAAAGALARRRLGLGGTGRRRQVLGWCSPFAKLPPLRRDLVIGRTLVPRLRGTAPAPLSSQSLASVGPFMPSATPATAGVGHTGASDPGVAGAARRDQVPTGRRLSDCPLGVQHARCD